MADKLQKYKYGGSAPRPTRTTRETTGYSDLTSPIQTERTEMAAGEIKADIMSSIRGDISLIIREELKNVLVKDFNALKSEPKSMQADITNNTAAIHAEIDHVKSGHQGHELWTIYMVYILLQATVTSLQTQVVTLKDRCEDTEGRMRRDNIRNSRH